MPPPPIIVESVTTNEGTDSVAILKNSATPEVAVQANVQANPQNPFTYPTGLIPDPTEIDTFLVSWQVEMPQEVFPPPIQPEFYATFVSGDATQNSIFYEPQSQFLSIIPRDVKLYAHYNGFPSESPLKITIVELGYILNNTGEDSDFIVKGVNPSIALKRA